jgi:VCBS repeat-containing protein
MANWANPLVTSTYVNFVAEVKDRDLDLAKGLDPALVTATNVVSGMQRWNSANNNWEKYNGTAWAALTSAYAINITGSATSAATATNATNIATTGASTTNSGFFVGFVASNTSGNQALTTTAALTFNPSTGLLSSTGFSGNLTLPSATSRIQGDFGNATVSSRPSFQSNVTNGNTVVQALPNGTSVLSGFMAYGNAAATNINYGGIYVNGANFIVEASRVGTGTAGVIQFNTGATSTARLSITANGGLSPGTTATAYGTAGQVFTSAGDAPPSWAAPAVPSNIAGGATSQILYQTAASTTGFISAPSTASTYLGWTGSAFAWSSVSPTVANGCIFENSQTISANYTITAGKSARSSGPITVSTGVTVTIPSGSRWVIL